MNGKSLKRISAIFSVFLFLVPLTSADSGCSWFNLGTCVSQDFFGFLVGALSSPSSTLIWGIRELMTQAVNISLFSDVWSIIVYVLSMFYGLLLIYTGFRFILSGDSVEKRVKAKSSLANILIMMILVQSSYLIYSWIIEIESGLTSVIFSMIPGSFFTMSATTPGDIGMQFLMLLPYIFSVLSVLILLALRYICVSIGVVFFAIGVFCYFIEPLNQTGKLIINGLIAIISLPFFYSIIFLASSRLVNVGAFSYFPSTVMTATFFLIVLVTVMIVLYIIIKAAFKVLGPVLKVVGVAASVLKNV